MLWIHADWDSAGYPHAPARDKYWRGGRAGVGGDLLCFLRSRPGTSGPCGIRAASADVGAEFHFSVGGRGAAVAGEPRHLNGNEIENKSIRTATARDQVIEHLFPSPWPSDSLAPARSALAGLWLRPDSFRRFPSGSSPSGEREIVYWARESLTNQ